MQTYFITDGRAVKIGKSHDAMRRLKQLQASTSVRLQLIWVTEGDTEKQLHIAYAAYRIHGEWYSLGLLSFDLWLAGQADRDDWIGDLAQDTQSVSDFPKDATYRQLQSYLRWQKHACRQARIAMAMAYREWLTIRRRTKS